MDKFSELEKLSELKEKGILSEEEFQMEKERVLLNKGSKINNIINTQTPVNTKIKNQKTNMVFYIIIGIFIICVIYLIVISNQSNNHANEEWIDINNLDTYSSLSESESITNKDTRSYQSENDNKKITKDNGETNDVERILKLTAPMYEDMAEKIWGYNKRQYGGILIARAIAYLPKIINRNESFLTPEERAGSAHKEYQGNYTSLELAHVYLFYQAIKTGELDHEGDVNKYTAKVLSDRAMVISHQYNNINKDVGAMFTVLAYGYSVSASEKMDLVKTFEDMFGKTIEQNNAQKLFNAFNMSLGTLGKIPDNDKSYTHKK